MVKDQLGAQGKPLWQLTCHLAPGPDFTRFVGSRILAKHNYPYFLIIELVRTETAACIGFALGNLVIDMMSVVSARDSLPAGGHYLRSVNHHAAA